jgi:hypothetical protein
MIEFLKKIKKHGFVCGFGWKPKAPQIYRVTEQQVRENAGLLEQPSPDIGRIARTILADLDISNYDKFKVSLASVGDFWILEIAGKKYKLNVFYRESMYSKYSYSIRIDGLKEHSFNEDEKIALSEAFEKIMDYMCKLREQEGKRQDQEILSKLFLNC